MVAVVMVDDVGMSIDGLSLGLEDAVVVLERTGGIMRKEGLSVLGAEAGSVRGVGGGAEGIVC